MAVGLAIMALIWLNGEPPAESKQQEADSVCDRVRAGASLELGWLTLEIFMPVRSRTVNHVLRVARGSTMKASFRHPCLIKPTSFNFIDRQCNTYSTTE